MFFGFQVIGFFSFQKFNFSIKVYFPRFHSFFFLKERESRRISVKREKLIIDDDSDHQNG
jgi:hypothetical protein